MEIFSCAGFISFMPSLYLESLSGGKPVRDFYCQGAAVDPLTIRSAWSRTVPMDTPFIRLLRA